MIKKKTVLVLGAGSSVEFGLPAGDGLATAIGQAVNFEADFGSIKNGDRQIWLAATENHTRDLDETLAAGQLLSRTLPLSRSIDDLLFNHGQNAHAVRLGKLAIAACILRAERGSSLMWNPNQDKAAALHTLSKTWLYKLFRFIWTGIRLDHLDDIFQDLSIINFNYDRCVEQFLVRAIQVAYELSDVQAQSVVRKLDIVHPYGQVGSLPWQEQVGAQAAFGAENADLRSVAAGIKTFTEQAHDRDEIESWRQRLRVAEQLVFLGFAFHPQNMELLQLGDSQKAPPWPRAYATVFRVPAPEYELVLQRIQGARGLPPGGYSEPILSSATCADFVDQYGAVIAG